MRELENSQSLLSVPAEPGQPVRQRRVEASRGDRAVQRVDIGLQMIPSEHLAVMATVAGSGHVSAARGGIGIDEIVCATARTDLDHPALQVEAIVEVQVVADADYRVESSIGVHDGALEE